MPFQSKAQERYMFANHPALAKKWAAMTDEAKLPPKKNPLTGKDSSGRPPEKRDDRTDFKPLHPGSKARHGISPPATEAQAMAEGHGMTFQPFSNKSIYGAKKEIDQHNKAPRKVG